MKKKCIIISSIALALLTICFVVTLGFVLTDTEKQMGDAIEMNDVLNSITQNNDKVQENDFSFLEASISVYDKDGNTLKGEREYKSLTEMQVTENKLGNSLFYVAENGIYVVIEKMPITPNKTSIASICVMFVLAVGLLVSILIIVIKYLLNPFSELEVFASEVARGNLDFPLTLKKQNVFGAFTVSFDLMREELKHSKEKEVSLKKQNFELLSSLTHDIKTPLQTISAITSVMETKKQVEIDDLEMINSKVNQISSLLNDIQYSIAKELTSIEVNLKQEYLKEVVEELILPLTKVYKNIKINEYPNLLINVDKTRLLEVIQNLVSNSLKYNPKGIIEFSFSRNEEFLIMNVFDGGTSLSKDDESKIFDKFFRGGNVSTENGNGLGLFIVKNILEKHGGFVELNTINGFSVDLGLPLV